LMVDREGVYAYVNGALEPMASFEIPDGKVAIYFDNIKCPFCKVFNVIWAMLVEDKDLSDVKFLRVVCTYFERECTHPEAKKAFAEFGVKRSPFVLLLVKKDGKIVAKEELPPARYNYDYLRIKKVMLRVFEGRPAEELEEGSAEGRAEPQASSNK